MSGVWIQQIPKNAQQHIGQGEYRNTVHTKNLSSYSLFTHNGSHQRCLPKVTQVQNLKSGAQTSYS